MKVLNISGSYYMYPSQYNTLESFINFINQNTHNFIPLKKFLEDNCVFPYFIAEDTKPVYLNFFQIEEIEEVDIIVLTRTDYEERLEEIIDNVCVGCVYYEEDRDGDNFSGHRNKINLDGMCYWKEDI